MFGVLRKEQGNNTSKQVMDKCEGLCEELCKKTKVNKLKRETTCFDF